MGREVRRVAAGWQHPKEDGALIPLLEGPYLVAWTEWEIGRRQAEKQWAGSEPKAADYMPVESLGDQYQMYETCSEGTPISPVFSTPEDLASWLENTGASAFGPMTATYEQWLRYAPDPFA